MSSQIQHKLFHFQVTPPEEMWGKITGTLDADTEFVLSKKLQHFQQAPSAANWENIKAHLEEDKSNTPVVPLFQRYRLPFKYGIAAASINFLAVLVSLIITQKTGSKETALQTQPVIHPKNTLKNAPSGSVVTNPDEPEQDQGGQNQLSFSSGNKTAGNAINKGNNRQNEDVQEQSRQLSQNPALVKRYILYSNTEGTAVKVSKSSTIYLPAPRKKQIAAKALK